MGKLSVVKLVLDIGDDLGRQLLRGISKYSRLHGPWVGYSGEWRQFTKSRGLYLPSPERPDGVIAYIDRPKNTKKIFPDNIPAIAVPRRHRIPGIPNIIVNMSSIGKMAAQHLLERGFKSLAFIGLSGQPYSLSLQKSFTKSVAENGIETHVRSRPYARYRDHWSEELALMIDWLNSLPKPVGIMAADNLTGQWTIDACRFAGLLVPDEVAVLVCSSSEITCDISNPPLSSIIFNAERAGYEAAELLDRMMAGEEEISEKTILVDATHIITRQSTDVLATDDQEVARAMNFIRCNAGKIIQVSEVVEATTLSRRALQKRFRSVIGRTIHEEIRHSRVSQIILMLLETNMSISEIALTLGYSSVKHIARYFKAETGTTPLAFRIDHGKG